MHKTLSLALFIVLFFSSIASEIKAEINNSKKTLTRNADPILVQGSELSTMLGEKIDNLRLYALIDGKFKPIPFQIDERDEKGNWVLTKGKDAGKDKDHGLLDKNDELVFMSHDIGDRAYLETLPEGYIKAIEIEVTDSLYHGVGWAYLLSFKTPPERSSIDYINGKEGDRIYRIDAKNYSLEIQNGIFTYLSISPEAGGMGVNIIDRTKMRSSAFLLWGLITLTTNEDDSRTNIIAYNDGHIRIIGRLEASSKLAGKVPTPKFTTDAMFYYNYSYIPSKLSIPFSPDIVFTNISLISIIDFNKNAIGMEFYSDKNPNEVIIDGKMSKEEENLDYGPVEWIVISGTQGTLMTRTTFGPEVPVIKNLYYKDSIDDPDPPENEPGKIGCVGYDLINIHKVKRGLLSYYIHFFIPANFKKGEEVKYNNIIDHPLEVKINQIARRVYE